MPALRSAGFTDSNWMTTCLSVGAPGGIGCPVNLIAQNGSRFTLSNPSAFASATLRPSVYVGYNWQIGSWVVGAEADAGWGKARNDMKESRRGEPGGDGEPRPRYRGGQHHLGCESARPRRLPGRHQRPPLCDRRRVLDPHGDERLLRQPPQPGRLVRGAGRTGIELNTESIASTTRVGWTAGWGPRPCCGRTGSRGSNIATPITAPSASPVFPALALAASAAIPSPRRRRCCGAGRVRVQVRRTIHRAIAPFAPVLGPRAGRRRDGAAIYFAHQATHGAFHEVVEIVPRARASTGCWWRKRRPFAKVDAGPTSGWAASARTRRAGSTGTTGARSISSGESEVVTAQVRAEPEDERKLLSSFLGFVDRHSGDQVATITIHYR